MEFEAELQESGVDGVCEFLGEAKATGNVVSRFSCTDGIQGCDETTDLFAPKEAACEGDQAVRENWDASRVLSFCF